MSSKDDIENLLNLYSRTVDSGDLDGFAELFKFGEWSVEGNTPSRGSQAIRDSILADLIIYDDGTPRTRHVNTNIEIDIDEDSNTAHCKRYVTILQQTESLPLQVIASGDYEDHFIRSEGTWYFSSTTLRRPFLGDLSRHMKSYANISS